MNEIENSKERKDAILLVITVVVGSVFTYICYQNKIREWKRCHIETEGVVKGFSLYSNKSLQVEIEYKKGEQYYTCSAIPTDYLRGCFYSKKQECIGRRCIVYYACDNPNNISYELIEQDSIISK
jgi:hypothetical protein